MGGLAVTDLALLWDDMFGEGDLGLEGADLERDDGLRTAVLVSLFTDRRAAPGDVADDEDPRGWWGDLLGPEGDRIGSRLWLLDRAKETPDVPVRAEEYVQEALAWMIEDGVADLVEVSAQWLARGRLSIEPVISRGGRTRFRERFEASLSGGRSDPPVIAPPPPVMPNQLPNAAAGADQAVAAGAAVQLDGSSSMDPDGSIATYRWEQISGSTVALSATDIADPTFGAPSTPAAQDLVFRLTVTDDRGGQDTDEVTVAVAAAVLTPVSYRFDTIENLRAFATFQEGTNSGLWEIVASGSTSSGSTGPGQNSAGPYAATDSGGADLATAVENSTFDLDVEMAWPGAAGRVLRLECAVMGAFGEDGEGLMVQGMASGGQWVDIGLIRGWAHANLISEGDDISNYDSEDIVCTRDGGWATFDVGIPDSSEQVRLRLVATGGAVHQHDIALWSAELRHA